MPSASSTAGTPATEPARSRRTWSRPRPTPSRPWSGCSMPRRAGPRRTWRFRSRAIPAPLVAAIARRGGRAKMRTGGVTAEAFPTAAQVLRFLRACTEARVPFKATAGLHHPLRAEYRLTYAPDSPRGTMFGFLNVFLTAVLLRHGLSDKDALGAPPGALPRGVPLFGRRGRMARTPGGPLDDRGRAARGDRGVRVLLVHGAGGRRARDREVRCRGNSSDDEMMR